MNEQVRIKYNRIKWYNINNDIKRNRNTSYYIKKRCKMVKKEKKKKNFTR